MRIIIEGADGVGKSTIVNKLAKKYNLDKVHFSYDDPKDLDFYFHTARKSKYIYDRHFISEVIYHKYFNRPRNLEDFEIKYLLEKSKYLDIKTIILTNDKFKLKNEEYDFIKKNIKLINDDYLEFGKKFNIPIVNTNDYKKIEEIING